MSAEQEKDPISLKRVRGNREGHGIGGIGVSGVRGGRVPGRWEATGLCPGLTPRSPRVPPAPRGRGCGSRRAAPEPARPRHPRGALASSTLC